MLLEESYFTPFKASIQGMDLPERFTFPFYYQPHPLCILAAKELQDYLKTQQEWQHNFGLNGNTENAAGKMFGVLLVKNQRGEVGYLSAFSGKLADKSFLPRFVPPVFDLFAEKGFFISGQKTLNLLTEEITALEKSPSINDCKIALENVEHNADLAIKTHRAQMIAGRKTRKLQRVKAELELKHDDFLILKEQLSQQSIREKLQLRDLTGYWQEKISHAQEKLIQETLGLEALRKQRKDLSAELQQKIFTQYRFLNTAGVQKSLLTLFQKTAQIIPPAGAGDCAAPKLLQAAFKTGLQPLALAEFWWGSSPKSEIRKHLNFYPSCQGKCQPILEHMLDGIELDDNPLLANPAAGKNIDIIYQDEVMLVINKPAEFLSVPGKNIKDSVYLRIQQAYPEAKGGLIVHRLDMSTSGLMLIALTKEAHKQLQKQFIKRTVKKRYVALLDGTLEADSGVIDLPLRLDVDDRPRQLVCYEHGRNASTKWEVIERNNKQTKVYFYPLTGRTHQLRVHSAHVSGLNAPIVGDDLYGKASNRLHLHAEWIEFNHPVTKELMSFQVSEEF
ncbi:MAG: RluA family pseudouridine synthase [Methyloprofundus sp.]|nr:RluA family pseudouridine synthase [Methyloprofundus sp.]